MLLFIAVQELLIAVAPLIEHRLEAHGLSSCDLQAQECMGSSSCNSWALVAPQHVESSQTRDKTHVPYIGKQILIHCTMSEVPDMF